jgi:hypothetical protein
MFFLIKSICTRSKNSNCYRSSASLRPILCPAETRGRPRLMQSHAVWVRLEPSIHPIVDLQDIVLTWRRMIIAGVGHNCMYASFRSSLRLLSPYLIRPFPFLACHPCFKLPRIFIGEHVEALGHHEVVWCNRWKSACREVIDTLWKRLVASLVDV